VSGTDDDRVRRRRQQAKTAGSLAPRTMSQPLRPSKRGRPRRWRDTSRAERFALVFSQSLLIVLTLAIAYLLAIRVSVLIGAAVVGYLVAMYVWVFVVMARRRRS
jgi:sterol desaturase/sphingolipid hydroxylase (fatty acid hydroxylase superfamily)